MNASLNWPLIRLLVKKDWHLFEKQLAAYVAGGILALGLLGMAKGWSFYLGSLLLLIVMIGCACSAVANSLVTERKERTLAFVMSLPISPLDFTLSKMLGNLVTFGVPYLVLTLGAVALIFATPLPDGLFVFWLLMAGHILLAFSISLAVAMSVESEGVSIFVMIASQVLINPFMMGLGQIPAITGTTGGELVVWSWQAIAILAAQLLVSAAVLGLSTWRLGRRAAFY